MKKQIMFAVLLIAVIGAIVYLQEPIKEAAKVTPLIQKSGTPAPELAGIAGELNTNGINISSLAGKKVILVDFWTYSCINCQRTLPYLTAWYDTYKDKGLEIIGVHAPEFEFEKKFDNVKRAIEKWNIKYPVVLDNDHETWRAFRNNYWPRKYLIDIDGYIVWDHIGEGGYEEAEEKIQELLKERMEKLGLTNGMPSEMAEVVAPTVEFGKIGTPELYLGYEFTRGNFGSKEGLPRDKEVTYTLPETRLANNVYLDGTWFVDSDHVRLVSNTGKVVLKYQAKNVNIVASSDPQVNVSVAVNGSPAEGEQIKNGKGVIKNEDLYNLVEGSEYAQSELVIDIHGPGFKLYTFTFG